MFELHVMGAVHASQAVLPGMIERGFGRIVNVASTAGLKGYAYVTRLLRRQARAGRADALARGRDREDRRHRERGLPRLHRHRSGARQHRARRRQDRPRRTSEVLAEYAKDAPIGRLIRPEEVAAAVLYLCSPDAAAVTGTTLTIAGGEI